MQTTLPWGKPQSAQPPPVKPSVPINDANEERFDLPVDNTIEMVSSQTDAQKAMVELVQSNLADIEQDFDPEDAIVDGFQEGIKLMPHQIIARHWMREREEGKKFGGILADDMGCVFRSA